MKDGVRPELPSYTTIRHSLIVGPPFGAVVQSHSYEPGSRLKRCIHFIIQ